MEAVTLSRIGLAGLAVMGQNLALNIAETGFPISVYNRTTSKVDETLHRAQSEGPFPLTRHHTPRDFALSLQRPRSVIILVKAGNPVDQTIAALSEHMESGDCIIDGGNEWYENTERRIQEVSQKKKIFTIREMEAAAYSSSSSNSSSTPSIYFSTNTDYLPPRKSFYSSLEDMDSSFYSGVQFV